MYDIRKICLPLFILYTRCVFERLILVAAIKSKMIITITKKVMAKVTRSFTRVSLKWFLISVRLCMQNMKYLC